MATQARWYNKTFEITPNKVMTISGFSTSYKLKSDTNDDTSGTKKTNTRGREPEEPYFSVKYLAAVGATPRNDFTGWRALVGKKDYLYIGKTKYGTHKFQLISADVSDVLLDNKGRTMQAVVTLHFREVLPTKKVNLKKDPVASRNQKTRAASRRPKAPRQARLTKS